MALGPIVAPEWLREHLGEPRLRVIDFRWYLDGRSGRAAYEAGHIQGAVFVDLEAVTGETGAGRHPLPVRDRFERELRRAGVNRPDLVIVYDDVSGSVAARLWWLLRGFGHAAVAVLDGGIQAWDGPLETGSPSVEEGDFRAAEPSWSDVVLYDQLRDGKLESVLLDARAGARYRGEQEPIDPKAGHIPGARSAPWQGNVDEDGRFLPPARLRERFRALGVEKGADAVLYCGSGVNATHNLLAMEVAGLPGARVYAGSWSDWSRHEDAPVATGAEP